MTTPAGYLLQNSYRHILELFDLPGRKRCLIYIQKAFRLARLTLLMRICCGSSTEQTFKYITFFCKNYFGHGYPPQVKYFVDEVDPKILIPCHGFNPERLLPKNGVQLLPIEGETYILDDGKLILEKDYE